MPQSSNVMLSRLRFTCASQGLSGIFAKELVVEAGFLGFNFERFNAQSECGQKFYLSTTLNFTQEALPFRTLSG